MTIPADPTTGDKTDRNDYFATLLGLLYKCLNLSDDKLRKPSDLAKSLVYVSIVLSVIVPSVCFAIFVYPTMTTYAASKAQVVSVPLLEQQVAHLKKLHRNSHAALTELEADSLLTALRNIGDAQQSPIELHRLAHDHKLTIVATDTLNESEVPPQFADYFTTTRFSWHFKGHFFNYLTFKKALWEQHPLIHMEREHLSARDDLKLDIIVDINLYQPKALVL